MIISILIISSAWILPSLLFNTFAGFYGAPSSLSGTSILLFELNYNHSLALQSIITLGYKLTGFTIIPKILGTDLGYYIGGTMILVFTTQLFIFLPNKANAKKTIKYFDSLIIILFVLGIIDWPPQILLYHFVFGILFSLSISWAFLILELWFALVIGLSVTAFLDSQYIKQGLLASKDKGRIKNRNIKRLMKSLFNVGKWLPAILICILVVAYSIPIALYGNEGIQQNVGYITSDYHPSQSLLETGDFLSEHSTGGNVLELPIIAGDYTINSTNSIWTVSTPLSTFTNSYIEYRDRAGYTGTLTFPIFNDFQVSFTHNLSNYLSIYGIKYIVISKNVNTGNYLQNYNLSDYEKYINYFNNSIGYSFVASFGNYTIFAINETNPLIYASNAYNQNFFVSDNSTVQLYNTFVNNTLNSRNDSLFYGLNRNVTSVNLSSVHIEWKQTSLNTYSIQVQSNTSFALNFLEGYSTQWGNYHWDLGINGFGVDKQHFVSNLFANGWILPKGNYSAEIYLSYSNEQNITYIVSFAPTIVLILIPAVTFIRLRVRKILKTKR